MTINRLMVKAANGERQPSTFSALMAALDPTEKAALVAATGTRFPAASAANTTADTVLATLPTVQAASLSTSTSFELDLDGNFDSIITGGLFNVKIKANTTTLATILVGNSQTAAGTLLSWYLGVRVYVDAVGVAGVMSVMDTRFNRTASATLNTAIDQTTGTGVDLSGGLTLTAVASMATANAGNILRLLRGAGAQRS